ncbi:MAG: FtsX-like permease family protein [Proteobacteria bacterium]|nr:FtsX-like permease family protein [Pseudomonadota bacterium]
MTNDFSLAWRLARRELRGGLAGFRVFLTCLALGVGAIAAVGGLSASIIAGLDANGTRLLGGEVDLRLLHSPASPDQIAYLEAQTQILSTAIIMRAMVRPANTLDKRAMVELKAVDQAYPLIGQLETTPPLPMAQLLGNLNGVWGAAVDANLMTRLGLKLGDTIRLGAATLQMRATVDIEPDRVASVFSFGPRLLIYSKALEATGLVQPGSQINYHYRMMMKPGLRAEDWSDGLQAAFPTAGWRVSTAKDAAHGVRRFIDRMTLFMTFVGLTVLLVGGLGITSAVRSYLDGKAATIATFKCLGASGRLIFTVYMMQILVLGGLGVVIGLIFGVGTPFLLIGIAGQQLPVAPVAGIYGNAIANAAAFGLLATITFALLPVARARTVKAAELFRARVAPVSGRPGSGFVAAAIVGVGMLAALTVLTANDRTFAAWFIGGAVVSLALLRGGAAVVMAAAARFKPVTAGPWRLVQANLHRRGAATPNIIISLGLGLSVLVAIALIEGNLRRQIEERLPDQAPAFFFIDIQPSQTAAFDAAVTAVPGTSGYQRVPTLRGRIVKIAGVPVENVNVAHASRWATHGDRALTFAAVARADTKIVAGKWWPAEYAGPPIISLDAGLAKGFGIGLGDTLTLNILGREITAKIASLRDIDWRSLRFDFAIIFAPGALEAAPHTSIAAIEAPRDREDAVERAATDAFPNVSAIRVREALQAAASILKGVGAAITGTAALTLLAGAVVLAGVIASEHQRRVYDAIVYKVLGATRRRVVGLYLLEYGVLGLITAVIAAAIGTLTAWAVIRFMMETEWTFLGNVVAATTGICLAVTLSMGLIGTWRALGHKAAPHLRNE